MNEKTRSTELVELQKKIARIEALMISVSTGRSVIEERKDEYHSLHLEIERSVESLDIKGISILNKNPFASLQDFWAHCRGKVPTYAKRREYVTDMYKDLNDMVKKALNDEGDGSSSMVKNMKPQVLVCRHCGNETVHSVLKRYENSTGIFDEKGTIVQPISQYYFLMKCETCSEPSLYGNWELVDDPEDLKEAKLLFPTLEELSSVVPESVRIGYRKALRVKKIDPDAFAVNIRKGLEYICKDQKARGDNLFQQLQDLAKRNVLPSVLADATDVLREIGNIGAHASEKEVGPELAETADDFFKLMIEYVYVLPSRLGDISAKLKS